MHEPRRIIIFDGICNLCNRWVNFIIKRDPAGLFHYTPMQSDAAQHLMAQYPDLDFESDTIVLISNGQVFTYSDAALEITRELPKARMLHSMLRIMPKPVRNGLYRFVARNRYRMFGKRSACMVPSEDMRERFL